jgi:hypothetical protein
MQTQHVRGPVPVDPPNSLGQQPHHDRRLLGSPLSGTPAILSASLHVPLSLARIMWPVVGCRRLS